MDVHPIFDELLGALTHRDRAIEDGHAEPPGGVYEFEMDLPEVGIRNYHVQVQWTMRGDRMVIEAVDAVDAIDGPVGLDPHTGTSVEKALYPRVAAEALNRRDDIMESWREQQ